MASAEDYAAWIVANKDKAGTPEFNTVAAAYQQARGNSDVSAKEQRRAAQLEEDRKTYAPTVGMSGPQKFLAGTGKAFSDLASGVGQLVGAVSRDDVAESRKRDAALMDSSAGMAGNIVGNVAAAVPTAFIPGANTIAGAGLIGAGMGLAQPSTSTGETLTNVGLGGAAGATVPLVVRGAQIAKGAVEPFYKSGQEQIVGRAINEAAGGQSQAAAQQLRSAAPLVPGSMPTAGQAAANPGIAALERTAVATDPVAMNDMARRVALQNDARIAALRGVAPDRAASAAARDSATSALYQAADAKPVSLTSELASLLERPSMKSAMTDAQKLAAEKGGALAADSLDGRGAHFIKQALDDMTNAPPQQGFGANQIGAIRDTKTAYLTELEKQLPEYGQARQTFAQMSRPINQADVASEIAKKSMNFRGDITPAAYAKALRDETAQAVTGQSNAKLASVMEPGQMQTLDAIKQDLLRSDYANTAGRGVGSDTVQKLAYSNLMAKSGLPSWVGSNAITGPTGSVIGNVIQRGADLGYKGANDEMRQMLAQALLDPKRTADLMEAGMVSPQMQALIRGLNRSGAAAGASVPGLVQANQQ